MSQAATVDTVMSASIRNLTLNLTGPLAAGAMPSPLPISPGGTIQVDWNARLPLVLISCRIPLADERLELDLAVVEGADAFTLPHLEFAPYTDPGAALPAYVPALGEDDRAAPFTLQLAARHVSRGAVSDVPAADLGRFFEATLIEGNLGKLIVLLTAEKNRLRRQSSDIRAMRRLEEARLDALDRYGADLGVPRLSDALTWDSSTGEIVSRPLIGADALPIAESDADFARRLKIYRPFVVPTRRRLAELLNGTGLADSPEQNNGLMGEIGLRTRFAIRESENKFAVAMRLFSSAGDETRTNFLDYLRRVRLVWPAPTVAADLVHAEREIPSASRARIAALRAHLQDGYQWPDDAAIAPGLANALARAARIVKALGSGQTWRVLRAQDPDGGSRYELGLGVDIEPPSPAVVVELTTLLHDPGRQVGADAEAEALILAARSEVVNGDENAAWLWHAAGLETVHRANAERLYLSHLPTRGLVVTGTARSADVGAPIEHQAHYHAPGDPGSNAALLAAMATADAAWQATGAPALDRIADDQAGALWDQARDLQPGEPAALVLAAAGLPVVQSAARTVVSLKQVPTELVETIRLEPGLANRIMTNAGEAPAELSSLLSVLRQAGVAAVLPLVLGSDDILLIASVIGLPEAGINLNERRLTGFRWYVVPLGGNGQITALGSRVTLTPTQPGLMGVVVLGYVRTDQTDPYEVQLDLPDGAVLSLGQYEFLMNALEHAFPIGVEINTFFIRKNHVDADGDGTVEPLRGSAGRSYRRFRDRRGLGRYAAASNPGPGKDPL
ncbi:hypothetical protein [Microvirga pakistanensis]|uniref:hypothetical protein n=1 Tax=Microvirga pakistanensis TaxID=1682650 RepID=UPI00106B755C|nr:hypothetical protein [Microvirga pakistanensis]